MVRILRRAAATGAEADYMGAIGPALCSAGVACDVHSLTAWRQGKISGNPSRDIVVVHGADVLQIQAEYRVIGVTTASATEAALRSGSSADDVLARRESRAAHRRNTFCVAASDYAAHYWRQHTGRYADRIVHPPIDTDRYMPAERQRLREVDVPVILHDAADRALAPVRKGIEPDFTFRRVAADCAKPADALRDGDLWLSLDASPCQQDRVIAALSTNLVVVGTNVGHLWAHAAGTVLRRTGWIAWRNESVGAVVFDWRQARHPEAVASHIRAAWQYRARLNGRRFARQWFSFEAFGRKWLEAIDMAARRLGVK